MLGGSRGSGHCFLHHVDFDNNLSARRVIGLIPLGSSLAGTRLACHKICGVATTVGPHRGAIENKAGRSHTAMPLCQADAYA